METLTSTRCVDVVVDVASARLGAAFTYRIAAEVPAIGARVFVPFRGREVAGWVVSQAAWRDGDDSLKAISRIDSDTPPLGPSAIRLAMWLSRRYACTLREAIGAVAPGAARKSTSAAFAFAADPAKDDRTGAVLRRAFGPKRFSAIAARRALRSSGQRIGLEETIRELMRLVRAGVLERRTGPQSRLVAPRRAYLVRRVPESAPKGPAQRRLAAVLDANAAGLPLADAARLAQTSVSTVRAAAKAGQCSIVESRHAHRPASSTPATPTHDQARAIEAIDGAMRDGTDVLLHGITGSGKTFVYARCVDRLRERGGRAIVLVPEISLTPQTAGRFAALFGAKVGVLHSGLAAGDRARVWEDARSGVLDVVVGARSAVFVEMPELRLIVIDEEHEGSYKQDVAPRYDTGAVARERMRGAGGVVLRGSATPSLEAFFGAHDGAMRYVRLNERATKAPLPPVEVVDMTSDQSGRRRPLGPALVNAMESALARREKVLLFVNRRGYAGLLLCRACGFAPKCRRCAISLVIHTSDGSMRCHVCGDAYRVATACPKCGSGDLKPFGFGTQRVEEEVRALFPAAGVVRMDSDTTSTRGAHGRLLDAFDAEADVLIGTQMIAKGLDYPSVTVVGVVSADIDLNRPDFRAAERTFALLTQVAGRAGRAAPGARVVVQTYSPDHYAIALASRHDYDTFAQRELKLRRELRYPPFGRLAYLSYSGVDATSVMRAGTDAAAALRRSGASIEVLGPAPEPLPKARGEYRVRIALKSDDEGPLLEACTFVKSMRGVRGVRVTPIVDPR